jgi:hypothetical protein
MKTWAWFFLAARRERGGAHRCAGAALEYLGFKGLGFMGVRDMQLFTEFGKPFLICGTVS